MRRWCPWMNYNILATGSDGNAVVVMDSILIDCGVSFKLLRPIAARLQLVLLTHRHLDHFNHATIKRLAAERPTLRWACGGWLVYKLVGLGVARSKIDVVEPGRPLRYALGVVTGFALHHDVPNMGWRIDAPACSVFYATDTAHMDDISAKSCDLYLIEGNYGEAEIVDRMNNKLESGLYSPEQRTVKTHMSREQAMDWLVENMAPHSRYIFMHGHKEKEEALT